MATLPLSEPEAAAPSRPFAVVARKRETADTWTLRLEPAEGEPLAVRPGQFTMLYAFGVGEVPVSISGDPAGPLTHTVRAVGAVTSALCAARRGDAVGVRGPFGNAWPVEQALWGDLLVVAGGIGLAPLRPALYEALARRSEYGSISLLYGARTPADLLYVPELERWRSRFDLHVDVTVDQAGRDWRGRVGVAPKLLTGAPFEPRRTTALLCGPEVMMRFTAHDLLDRGVPAEKIYVSLERNMRCGAGHCGHCQLGPLLICRDGPVFRWDQVAPLLAVREL
jgi:NAD(P)H-flavin reductase